MAKPVFIARTGRSDLVVMSHAVYEQREARLELYSKLDEAERAHRRGHRGIPHTEASVRVSTLEPQPGEAPAKPRSCPMLRSSPFLGSRRWFDAFAQEKTQHNLMDQWMFNASPAAFMHADQKHAQFMLVLGTNPRISNRGHNATDSFREFVDDKSRTLVVVDPRETETTRAASRHLRVQPGTDSYLLLGMAATIVAGGLTNAAFIGDKTLGLEAVRAALAAVDVNEMAARCGIDADALVPHHRYVRCRIEPAGA